MPEALSQFCFISAVPDIAHLRAAAGTTSRKVVSSVGLSMFTNQTERFGWSWEV